MPALVYAIIIVLGYERTVAGLIAYAQTVIQKMTGNAYFPNATQILTSLAGALTAHQNAVSSSKTQKGLKGQRTATKQALVSALYQARDLVRTVCEANPESALAIAESAGMTLGKRPARNKPLIEILQASVSGSVVCRAKAPGIPDELLLVVQQRREDLDESVHAGDEGHRHRVEASPPARPTTTATTPATARGRATPRRSTASS